MGDLNSYAMEDPIDAIKLGADDTAATSDDYVNLIAQFEGLYACLLYTSDAADERSSVDLGGRRIIKHKKKKQKHNNTLTI